MPAYLDHAASTPLRPEALEAMLPYLTEHYGNPSGAHRVSRVTRLAVDEASPGPSLPLASAPA